MSQRVGGEMYYQSRHAAKLHVDPNCEILQRPQVTAENILERPRAAFPPAHRDVCSYCGGEEQ